MYTPAFATILLALATVVSANSANPEPQYALMTVANEYTLNLIDAFIASKKLSEVGKLFTPVKEQVESELKSGKATLVAITGDIGEFLTSAEEVSSGFTSEVIEVTKKNPVEFYKISADAPEASWDFFYDAASKAAAEAKNDKITGPLKTLKEEVDSIVESSSPDASVVSSKVAKFLESAKAVSPDFEDLFYSKGDIEIEKYRAYVASMGVEGSSSGVGSTDAGSDSTTIDEVSPLTGSAPGSTHGSSNATGSVSTTTPVPSTSGASSVVLAGTVSGLVAAMTAYAL